MARSAAKRASKSLSDWLNRAATGQAPVGRSPYTSGAGFRLAFGIIMGGLCPGRPCGAEIGEPGLDDLDLDLDGAATGENQRYVAGGQRQRR